MGTAAKAAVAVAVAAAGGGEGRGRVTALAAAAAAAVLGPTGICPTSTSRHRRRRRASWWMSCRCRRLCCCCCCSRGTSFLQPRQKEEGSSGGDHHPPSPSSNPDSHKLPNLRFKPWPRHHLAWPVWKRRRVALKQSAAPVGVPPDTSCVGRDEFLYLGVCKVGGGSYMKDHALFGSIFLKLLCTMPSFGCWLLVAKQSAAEHSVRGSLGS